MTAEYFLSLKDQRREAVLTKKGVHLSQREKEGLVYDLYKVDSFFVEFCYYISKNSSVTTSVFTDTKNLKPYLEDNRIAELLEASVD